MGLERFDTVMSFVVVMLLLSMLVTILVQCVVAVSGLRGWNLALGLQQLLQQVDPKIGDHAQLIANAVLEHPTLAHMPTFGGRRKATAIRQGELMQVLKALAAAPPKTWSDATKKALNDAIGAAGAAGAAPQVKGIVDELTKLFPQQAQAVEDAVKRGVVQATDFENKVGTWFGTLMDRTTERFVLHTRWITAACAFALAIALQVDVLQTFRQLSTNVELRTQLIQDADKTLQQSQAILDHDDAPLASRALKATAGEATIAAGDKTALAAAPANLVTRKQGRDWIANTIDVTRRDAVAKIYDKKLDDEISGRLKDLGTSFEDIKASFAGNGLLLVHNATPQDKLVDVAGIRVTPGILVTGLFLSLGAPFWFNALKQLANLRPTIAGKMDKESDA